MADTKTTTNLDWAIPALEAKMAEIEKTLPVVLLSQSSFDQGTYRIKTPGRYVLTEDIRFNPNRSTYNTSTNRLEGPDWMPTAAQIASGAYPVAPVGAYHMGFFSAITIESDNVVIDLNGFTLEQHIEHYLQQRFFSIIELAPTPFIQGQGPSNFGIFEKHQYIKIHNGDLGLTSHEAIHGNGTKNLILKDLTCYDYEQGAIAINGGSIILMKNIQIERNSQDALVRATYSQGRFIRSFLRRIIASGNPVLNVNGLSLSGSLILSELELELDSVFNDVILQKREPTSVLFNNPDPSNTCDGSVYGIVLNKLGAAVGPFLATSDHVDNRLILLENITICGIDSDPVEVPALCMPSDHTLAQRGPVGDVIRINMCTDDEGRYLPNTLSNAQFYVSKYASLIGVNPQASPALYDEWLPGLKILSTVMAEQKICFMYNKDAMSHTMKGNIGIFLSGASAVMIDSVHLERISNHGAASKGNDHDGYEGNRTRGIAATACKSLILKNVNLRDLSSQTADVYGLDFVHACSDVTLAGFSAMNLNPAKFINAPHHQGKCSTIRGKSLVTDLNIIQI